MTDTIKENSCPKGTVWCPMRKKCVPPEEMKSKGQGKGKGFGQGKGPVGVPKREDVDALVDEVFDGGFAQFGKVRKSEKQIDMLLDVLVSEDKVDYGKGSISTTGRPYDHPIKMKVIKDPEVTVDECAGPMMGEGRFEDSEYDGGPEKPDNPKKVSNKINQVPNQNVGGLLKSVHDELSEATVWQMVAEMRKDVRYKRFFINMMNENGITFEDLSADFVDSVNHAWNEAWQHPMRRGGGSAYGSQAGGGGTRGGFGSIRGSSAKARTGGGYGMIRGKNEQDDVEDDDEKEIEEKK